MDSTSSSSPAQKSASYIDPSIPSYPSRGNINRAESETESMDSYDLSFEERLPKIRELCQMIWPEINHTHTQVAELRGGGWNKIISIETLEDDVVHQYILRIPMDPFDVSQNVAILTYLWGCTPFSIPKVIHFDTTHDNPLDYPYIIITRLAGQDLGQFTAPSAGLMEAADDGPNLKSDSPVKLAPFGTMQVSLLGRLDESKVAAEEYSLLTADNFRNEPPGLSAKDVLLLAFRRKIDQAIEDMYDDGLLEDKTICLWHTDLFPRYIMVDTDTDEGTPRIIGVLDWDQAGFAPRFITCRPPDWLWGPGVDVANERDDGTVHDENSTEAVLGSLVSASEDEPLAPVEPQSPEAKEIKSAFDLAAGETYVAAAYDS
ncbi:Uu.00g059620.m01.CDS01 [Anthostomella pinea]|uniref:Uu.00g059620.m01.CDS01 n=1 Tax=Anthostomella pinea TaxID=933095 RepID=A0AAI8VTA3_9PEZI|nr:Uu.00g059620.m01.CDS01 [Anthostomella pinea]